MNFIETHYARFGYTRAPREGFFNFRLRAESCAGLPVIDANALRERLFHMWCDKQGLERRRLLEPHKALVTDRLLTQVFRQWDRVIDEMPKTATDLNDALERSRA